MEINFLCSCGEKIDTYSMDEWDAFEIQHYDHFDSVIKRYPEYYWDNNESTK